MFSNLRSQKKNFLQEISILDFKDELTGLTGAQVICRRYLSFLPCEVVPYRRNLLETNLNAYRGR